VKQVVGGRTCGVPVYSPTTGLELSSIMVCRLLIIIKLTRDVKLFDDAENWVEAFFALLAVKSLFEHPNFSVFTKVSCANPLPSPVAFPGIIESAFKFVAESKFSLQGVLGRTIEMSVGVKQVFCCCSTNPNAGRSPAVCPSLPSLRSFTAVFLYFVNLSPKVGCSIHILSIIDGKL
jgi:hypothetical protein